MCKHTGVVSSASELDLDCLLPKKGTQDGRVDVASSASNS
jgi:hypothetical protein